MTNWFSTKGDGSVAGKFTTKGAAGIDAELAGNRVGKNIASRFGGSPPADAKQAAADLKVMTAQPKPSPVKFRYGRV
jgi:hypothetical protein